MEIRKNPKSDLERKKSWLFQIGMIVALVAVMTAFEYKSYEKSAILLSRDTFHEIPEYLVPVTVHKKKQLPPPVPKIQLHIVEDSKEDLDDFTLDALANEDTPVPNYFTVKVKEETIPDDILIAIPEIMPEFPGGFPALYKYLRDHVQYPVSAKEMGIQATVYLSFVVEKDGSISQVEILRGVGGGCTEEAIRVVKTMPDWSPGTQMGRPVRVIYNLPIKFTLQ
ncbi:MAG: TonB family protein [Bacteroidales bacterium]|jgi:protein TonB|nr:TonB family protein [Bacteroidales bacterium]